MIDPYIQQLMSLDGWVKRYWEMLPDYGTMEATYEAIERQYMGAFGCRKYADFESFRQCFYRFQRNKST